MPWNAALFVRTSLAIALQQSAQPAYTRIACSRRPAVMSLLLRDSSVSIKAFGDEVVNARG
jgi:hypothetical protein